MDTLPQELFSYIILLLEPQDRLVCTYVNKSWNTKIRQGALLYNSIRCTSLFQNALLMRQFNDNLELRHKVKTLQYHLLGRLSFAQIKSLSERFNGLQHFQYFVCENNSVQGHQMQTKSKPLHLKNLQSTYQTTRLFDTSKHEEFGGWPDLKSLEETSDCMYTLFILECTQNPLNQLTIIWLNFVHINMADRLKATDRLANGLINSPNLKELTLMNAHIELGHMDMMNEDCEQLKSLALISTCIDKARFEEHQHEDETPFIIDYYGHSNDAPVSIGSLKSLKITGSNFEEGLPIFSYIAENYTDLQELVCEAQVVNGNPTFTADESGARELFQHCSQLKKFESNLIPWTGQFIDLIDQHTTATKEEFDIDISDLAASTFIALCRSKRLREALKTLTYNFNESPQSLDTNLMLFSCLVELNLNYDCFLDDEGDKFDLVDQDMSVPPAIPIVSLLEACTALRTVSLGHLPIIIDRMPSINHNVQVMQLTGCSLESFGRHYSFYNYVSDHCYELEALEIDEGNYRYSPSVRELTLSLYNHTKLYSLAPLHNRVYHYVKHLDEQAGINDWYLVRRRNRYTNEIYHTLLDAPSYDMVKSAKYVTIKCHDSSIFYKEKNVVWAA
ncbi:hypothetical protein FB192DRAFT_1339669 [Mucor lusitanicus]|uniref:F-box domain-containing protein n=2 Tax=Mucor circinelloides f. lusitanicus TaxID=29924 RepID=A0A162MSZ6_MUCCL|nr:hypothetical protein FB192DRAFT_1339669 [Mucor lusitanicus]OAD05085.1 hypothetical protein MUCCIDRAFT_161789 [Mucor lusitanicus CBS 277.49]